VVELQSLDEDRLGEQLSVIWELEVGQTVTPAQGLPEHINPDAFDNPTDLAGFIDAMRWGAVTSADPNRYQAPFWSGAAVEAYQLEPLRRALASPRANLLLADDVGLGKTIEAGLVLQELLLRHRARTAVIVCPPSLALKWQDEMREKFGLHFVIVNSELMAAVRRSHGLQATARFWGDGRSLFGPAPEAATPGGAESPAHRRIRRPRLPRTLRAGG
jgi:hypothetical protein